MDRADRMTVGPQPQRTPATLQARTAGAAVMPDLRPQAAAQRALMQSAQAGPTMVAQRRSLQAAFGPAAQFKDDPVAQRAGPEDELQMKAAPGVAQLAGPEDELQMKVAQLEEIPGARRNETGMPDSLKSGIESLSGVSMDGVQVHYNSSQPAQLNALAYAQGRDIHVGPGQEQHLPHEAWHVVQQAQGRVQPTTQMKDGQMMGGTPVNTDPALEAEADRMGAQAARGAPAQLRAR